MVLEGVNVYHPFTESNLGFFVNDVFSNENCTPFILESIDLYYQPVEEPVLGIIYCVIGLLWLFVAEFIQLKLFFMMNKENGVVKEVTQLYSLVSLIVGPIWWLIQSVTDFVHPVNELIGDWFCLMANELMVAHFYVLGMHSFITAIIRYWFIVHEERVNKYGKEKTKKCFLYLTIFLLLVLVILDFSEGNEINILLHSINKCNGIDHRVFLINTSPFGVSDPVYCKFGNLNDVDTYGNVLEIIRRTSCILKAILILILSLNITEAITYYKIFSHIQRFVVCTLDIKVITLIK